MKRRNKLLRKLKAQKMMKLMHVKNPPTLMMTLQKTIVLILKIQNLNWTMMIISLRKKVLVLMSFQEAHDAQQMTMFT